MPRQDWECLKPVLNTRAPFDLENTPIQAVAHDASVVASCIALTSSSPDARIEIYREDAADRPTPINKDVYTVWEHIPHHVDYKAAVAAASTSDNDNLRAYLSENVFIVKERPGPDHWLESLPADVKLIVRST